MRKTLAAFVVAALLSGAAMAHEKGTWIGRFGVTKVDPKSDNHPVVDVDDNIQLNLNAVYFFTDNLAIDILASTPFTHDILLKDGTKAGETKHLPPTISLQYHFGSSDWFYPYIGAGVNFTLFFDEETTGPLAGAELSLEESFGVAAQLGADFRINDRWYFNVDARWINIETEAQLDGASIGDVEIDPLVYGMSFGFEF